MINSAYYALGDWLKSSKLGRHCILQFSTKLHDDEDDEDDDDGGGGGGGGFDDDKSEQRAYLCYTLRILN